MDNYPRNLKAINLKNWLESEFEKPIIIDVREILEIEIASFPKEYIHIPLSQVSLEYVSEKLKNFQNRKFVVLCHMGIRSYNFGQWLLENQFVDEIWNLEEGIDGWSKYIDGKIPRY